jgi:hypothetical protein
MSNAKKSLEEIERNEMFIQRENEWVKEFAIRRQEKVRGWMRDYERRQMEEGKDEKQIEKEKDEMQEKKERFIQRENERVKEFAKSLEEIERKEMFIQRENERVKEFAIRRQEKVRGWMRDYERRQMEKEKDGIQIESLPVSNNHLLIQDPKPIEANGMPFDDRVD